jgi:hypothetical protein
MCVCGTYRLEREQHQQCGVTDPLVRQASTLLLDRFERNNSRLVLQLAAAITIMRDPSAHHCPKVHERLRNAPPCPIWATACDNQTTKSWAAKKMAKSERGQNLLSLYCACTAPCCGTRTSSSSPTGYRPPTNTLPMPSRVRPNYRNKRTNHSHLIYNRHSTQLHSTNHGCISSPVLGCARRSCPCYPATTEHL